MDTQLARCEDLIEVSEWTQIADESDPGVSGSIPPPHREGFGKIMQLARAGAIDCVVVSEPDRLSRNTRDFLNIEHELSQLGVEIVFLSGETTPLQRQMRSMFAEEERRQIRDRMVRGLRRTVEDGFFPGGPPPTGYRTEPVEGHPRRKKLVINEEEAVWVRAAVERIVEDGMTTKETADWLNAQGYQPRRAARFTYQNVRRQLLDLECMSGRYTYARRRQGRNAATGPPIEIEISPLISKEMHERLRVALGKTSTKRSRYVFYPLRSGRLVGPCGNHFFGVYRADRDFRQYQCNSRRPYAEPRCDCHRIHADEIEDLAWSTVTDLLTDRSRLTQMARDFVATSSATGDADAESIAEAQRKIAKYEGILEKQVTDLLLEGTDAKTVARVTRSIEDDLAHWRRRLATLQAWSAQSADSASQADRLMRLANVAEARLGNMAPEEQHKVMELLDLRVIVTDWVPCDRCKTKGRITDGSLGGSTCPDCHGSKYKPRVRIEGIVFDHIIEVLDGEEPQSVAPTGIPFTVASAVTP